MTKEELQNFIESYCKRLTFINDCFELFKHLTNCNKEYKNEINEFPAFYQLSLKSFLHNVIIELAKIYDFSTEKNATGVIKLLNLCESNTNLFLRKYSYEITDYYPNKTPQTCTESIDVRCDIKKAREALESKKLNDIRDKLRGQRDKFYAHLDKEYQMDSSKLINDFPLSYDEIKYLISTVEGICNDLLYDLCRTTYVCQTSNWNDIDNVLSVMKKYRKIRDEKFNKEIEKMRQRTESQSEVSKNLPRSIN